MATPSAQNTFTLPQPLSSDSIASIDPKTTIVLVANDEISKYAVTRGAIVKESALLENMLAEDEAEELLELPVPVADSETLAHVVAFVEHNLLDPMNPIEKPLRHALGEVLDQWHKDFIYRHLVEGGDERKHQKLISLVCAACFLECRDLQEIACAAVASMIRLKDRVEVREKLFGLEGDFQPSEWEEVKKTHAWCFQEQQKAAALSGIRQGT